MCALRGDDPDLKKVRAVCIAGTPNKGLRPLRLVGSNAIRVYLLRKYVTIWPLYGILANMGRVVCPLLQSIREGGRHYERIKNRAGQGRTDDL